MMRNKRKRARLRRPRGVLVSLCFVAAMALVIGSGIFGQRSAEVQALSDTGQTTNFTEEVVEVNVAQMQEETLEIASDPQYGEYEKSKVLLLVDDTTDMETVNAVLANTTFAETKNVSDQDISAGYVQVTIDGDMAMGQALDALEAAGLKAQPNYIYHPLEGDVLHADATSDLVTESPEGTNETEDADEGLVESADSTDSVSGANSESSAQRTPENDLDIMDQLLTAASTGEGFVSSDDLNAAAAVSIDDPDASDQWMLESLNAYRAWGIVKCKDDNETSPKVSVAVIDTGCLTTHEDLVSNIRATYNSVTSALGPNAVSDSIGHGTHVAGIVAADANNGKGVAGVSYDAGLVIIKASKGDTNNFSTVTLSDAYDWLMASDGGRTNAQKYDVRVVNMSLGGAGNVNTDPSNVDHVLYNNITKAKNTGILTVCAAGNAVGENAQPPYDCIPGDYEDCLTVINLMESSGTANDASGKYAVSRAYGSNFNDSTSATTSRAKNISAPGTSIYSTINDAEDPYGYKSGTSMATPGVAGVAALLFAYDPSLSADEARDILEQTAKDIGPTGWDYETGYGEVDAYRALQILSARISSKSVLARGEQNVALELCCADDESIDPQEWTWTSSDPSVLAVDSNTGTVSAVGAGTATLTATHKAIEGRSVTKEVSVGSADLSRAVISLIPDQTYTGSEIKPSVTVRTEDGQTLTLGTDYRVAYTDNINAGNATVTILPGTNASVSGSKTIQFRINPADINKATGSIVKQTYTGSAITPSPVLYFNGTKIPASNYTITYENNVNPCLDYASAIITGTGNFTGTKTITFSIMASLNDVTIEAIPDQEYTGGTVQPALRVRHHGVDLLASTPGTQDGDYVVSYTNNTELGTATVTLTGKNIYTGSKSTTFKIVQKNISSSDIEIKPIPNQTYAGKPLTPAVTIKHNGRTLVLNTDYTVAYSNNNTYGTGIARIKGINNYKGAVDVNFVINGISLKSQTVTVQNVKDKVYNGEPQTQNDIIVHFGGTLLKKGVDYTVKYRVKGTSAYVNPVGDKNKDMVYELVIEGKGKYSDQITRDFPIYAKSSGTNNSGNSTNKPNNSNNNNSNGNNNSSTASQPAPSAPSVTGTWKKSGNRWWFKLDSKSQTTLKSAKDYPYNRWVTIKGKRYYFDGAGWMRSGWLQWNNNWYWLGSDGAMKTGWHKTGGKWYYLFANGIMQKGWLTDGGKKYYLSSSGAMLTKWQKIAGSWYYFNGSGAMQKGWMKSGGKWYHLNLSSGAMDVNWFTDTDGKKYFLLSPSGQMLTGWVSIDGVWYYFNGSGVMQKNKWIGNYYVESNGAMAKGKWIGRYHVNSSGKWDATR